MYLIHGSVEIKRALKHAHALVVSTFADEILLDSLEYHDTKQGIFTVSCYLSVVRRANQFHYTRPSI